MGRRRRWIQFERPAAARDRLVEPSLAPEYGAQVAMEDCLGAFQSDRPADVLDRFRLLAQPGRRQSEQMQGLDVLWINGEYLPAQLLGGLQAPRLMMLYGGQKRFGNRGHGS